MQIDDNVLLGLTVPFIGTTLGAAVVFFMKKQLGDAVTKALTGFAAGVMVAASVWSLILPAIEQSEPLGCWSFIPALIGFWLGVLFLLLLDRLIPRLYQRAASSDGYARTMMTALAVTLHNIPEGMAVGIVYAGWLSGIGDITAGGALALATGIAIQNFPEGAIISMPLYAQGKSRSRSFLIGTLSGAVEPLFGLLTIAYAWLIMPLMPYLLTFAAGAMMYVVTAELIPEMSQGDRSEVGVLLFTFGFTLMMSLDVGLG